MEKLTISIKEKEIIAWVNEYAKENKTSVSAILESYLKSLRVFDSREVMLSKELQGLRGSRMHLFQYVRGLENSVILIQPINTKNAPSKKRKGIPVFK
jgi:hypothetical protein